MGLLVNEFFTENLNGWTNIDAPVDGPGQNWTYEATNEGTAFTNPGIFFPGGTQVPSKILKQDFDFLQSRRYSIAMEGFYSGTATNVKLEVRAFNGSDFLGGQVIFDDDVTDVDETVSFIPTQEWESIGFQIPETNSGETASGNFAMGQFVMTDKPAIIVPKGNPYLFESQSPLYCKEVICAVEKTPWSQIIGCDDRITVQVQSHDEGFGTDIAPRMYFVSGGSDLIEMPFTNVGGLLWQVDYDLSAASPMICRVKGHLELWLYNTDTSTKISKVDESDSLEITNRSCSVLIAYSNATRYAGIDYSQGFEGIIRIPAQLWKQSNPEESEVYRKSNGERVLLNHRISRKKTLEVGFVPQEYHEQIMTILGNQNIEIDGRSYVKDDRYNYSPINRYALTKGNCMLTDKTFFEENID